MVKIVTVNILYDLTEWAQRETLLIDGLKAEKPDLIALQEVKLPENTAAMLALELDMPYIHLVPDLRNVDASGMSVGNAILSRYPFVQKAVLDLQTQGRVAQYVQVDLDGQPLVFCNGHYYWYPGHHVERVKQVQLLIDWLSELPASMPVIAVGDFNGTKETPAITLMKQHFTSAYALHHGDEPKYTCPTPLARRNWKKALKLFVRDFMFNLTIMPWRGTLDYIFINQHVQVKKCQMILNKPAPKSFTLYPSDHFGIAADLIVATKS